VRQAARARCSGPSDGPHNCREHAGRLDLGQDRVMAESARHKKRAGRIDAAPTVPGATKTLRRDGLHRYFGGVAPGIPTYDVAARSRQRQTTEERG
jgi:hypothetical protein